MTEAQHQRAVIQWSQQPHIRERWPELKYLAHVKNEEKAGAREVAIDRAIGVKKGFPDLILPVPRGGYGCLLLEMKNEKGCATPEQRWWVEKMNEVGNHARVCHGWQEAVKTLEWYLGLEDKKTDG